MKTFKDYLTESKRTFAFRVKIADYDLDGDALDKIERGLSEFRLNDITKPKSTPVQRCAEFATLGPVGVEHFEVKTDYPAVPHQVQRAISNATGIPVSHIFVSNASLNDDDISEVDAPKGAILNDPELKQDDNNAQDHVGFKRVESLLKELGKDKSKGEQVKGTNDALLAKVEFSEKAAKTTNDNPEGKMSPVGSTKNKLQGPRGK
jgi:hypothetical protein